MKTNRETLTKMLENQGCDRVIDLLLEIEQKGILESLSRDYVITKKEVM